MLNMSTLHERLMEICRDQGIENPIGKDIQSLTGLSSGRITQIKQERDAAKLGADTMQAITRMGYSADWVQDGRGPKRPVSRQHPLPDPSNVAPGPELPPAVRALMQAVTSAPALSDADVQLLTDMARRMRRSQLPPMESRQFHPPLPSHHKDKA